MPPPRAGTAGSSSFPRAPTASPPRSSSAPPCGCSAWARPARRSCSATVRGFGSGGGGGDGRLHGRGSVSRRKAPVPPRTSVRSTPRSSTRPPAPSIPPCRTWISGSATAMTRGRGALPRRAARLSAPCRLPHRLGPRGRLSGGQTNSRICASSAGAMHHVRKDLARVAVHPLIDSEFRASAMPRSASTRWT